MRARTVTHIATGKRTYDLSQAALSGSICMLQRVAACHNKHAVLCCNKVKYAARYARGTRASQRNLQQRLRAVEAEHVVLELEPRERRIRRDRCRQRART